MPTWDRRFTKFWIDEWTLKPDAETAGMESRSSAQLLNMAGIAANAVAGNADYSLRIASIPARIVELAAFAALAVLFYAATGSPVLTFVTLFFVSAILLDVSYKAFFNSFYEERASLLYLTILVPATVMAFKAAGGWGWKVVFAVALALFASSKAQFAPTPAILLIVYLLQAYISGAPGLISRRGLAAAAAPVPGAADHRPGRHIRLRVPERQCLQRRVPGRTDLQRRSWPASWRFPAGCGPLRRRQRLRRRHLL